MKVDDARRVQTSQRLDDALKILEDVDYRLLRVEGDRTDLAKAVHSITEVNASLKKTIRIDP